MDGLLSSAVIRRSTERQRVRERVGAGTLDRSGPVDPAAFAGSLPPTIQACAGSDLVNRGPSVGRAVFVDRDGTIIRDHPYSADPDEIELLPGAVSGLRLLQAHGYRLIVVTNQSGIARGHFGAADLCWMHDRLSHLLLAEGVVLTAYYYCPHHPDGTIPELARFCPHRKPGSNMLERASREWSIDLVQSWIVGDQPTDAAAGRGAGCWTVVLQLGDDDGQTLRAPSLGDAAERIIACDEPARFAALATRRVALPG